MDPNTGERVQKEATTDSKQESEENLAFILRKIIYGKFADGGENDESEIDIKNPRLWEILKSKLGHYPYHTFRGSPVTLYSPYEALVFNWDILQEEAEKQGNEGEEQEARDDLKELLDTISGGASGCSKLDKYFKTRSAYLEQRTIQFDDIWTIFPPGTLIYGKPFQNQDQVFLVQDNKQTWPRKDDRPQQFLPWKMSCWTYDWTGETFERTSFSVPIEQFDGHRPIIALPYFPFDMHPQHEEIKMRLIERGKNFRKLCKAKEGDRLFEYAGDTIFGKKGFSGLVQDDDDADMQSRSTRSELSFYRRVLPPPSGGLTSYAAPSAIKSTHVESRVMVDYLSYFRYGDAVGRNGLLNPSNDDPDCTCSDCVENQGLAKAYRVHFDRKEHLKKKAWEEEQYMLCPPRVLGYILREKQWAQLQVDLVEAIVDNDEESAWSSRLQLADSDTKELLFDLVRSHVSTSKKGKENRLEVNDIIPQKGKGLVILLYGPPGVGKTSTAETIAVASRKPLFSISVADVGTNPRHVEANLAKIFYLATSWQAILLIDEADVFLESRGRGQGSSTDKNALVAVFLRVLEYYQGIMFLTTNQIAQFDVAIPSRIHIAIKYESLTKHQMENIFKGFLDPLDENGLIEEYDEINKWLKEDVYSMKFDGRQIRNIVTSALGLARAEAKNKKNSKGKLKRSHLKKAVGNARAFKEEFLVQFDRYKNSQEKMIQ